MFIVAIVAVLVAGGLYYLFNVPVALAVIYGIVVFIVIVALAPDDLSSNLF